MYIDQALAQRIEAQQAQGEAATVAVLQQRFAVPSACTLPLLGGYAIMTGPDYPVNRGIGVGCQETVSVADFQEFEELYNSAGLSPELELHPFVNTSFVKLVAQRGFSIYRFYNIYLLSLSSYVPERSRPLALDIHQVKEEESLLWSQTVAGTSQIDNPIVTLARATFYRPEVLCFLATFQGEVAGGAALSIQNGIGTLFFMGTVPAFRQRGVQAALLAERLAVAAERGCDLALCGTNPGNQSQRNVQRQGFSLAYTKPFLRKERWKIR